MLDLSNNAFIELAHTTSVHKLKNFAEKFVWCVNLGLKFNWD